MHTVEKITSNSLISGPRTLKYENNQKEVMSCESFASESFGRNGKCSLSQKTIRDGAISSKFWTLWVL